MTENMAPDGTINVMLVKLYLDRLGTLNHILRLLGQLSTLCIKNITPWTETSSRVSDSLDVTGEER